MVLKSWSCGGTAQVSYNPTFACPESNNLDYQKITYKAAVIARIAKDKIANTGSV